MRSVKWLGMILVMVLLSLSPMSWGQQKGWFRQTSGTLQASPLLMDLDRDSRQEIIVPDFAGKLFIYKHDGTKWKTGVPYSCGIADGTMASAAVGEVKGPGQNCIVIVSDDASAQHVTVLIFTVWMVVRLAAWLLVRILYHLAKPRPASSIAAITVGHLSTQPRKLSFGMGTDASTF